MSTFHTQSFAARFASMGDEAEGVFETVHASAWDRYGLNRPSSSMKTMPARVRYTPDYLTSFGFIEVKGVGRDQTLKIKCENWNCLMFWNGVWETEVFVWDSHKKRYCYVELAVLDKMINDPASGVQLKHFNDPKGYFAFPLKNIATDWHEHTQDELELAA